MVRAGEWGVGLGAVDAARAGDTSTGAGPLGRERRESARHSRRVDVPLQQIRLHAGSASASRSRAGPGSVAERRRCSDHHAPGAVPRGRRAGEVRARLTGSSARGVNRSPIPRTMVSWGRVWGHRIKAARLNRGRPWPFPPSRWTVGRCRHPPRMATRCGRRRPPTRTRPKPGCHKAGSCSRGPRHHRHRSSPPGAHPDRGTRRRSPRRHHGAGYRPRPNGLQVHRRRSDRRGVRPPCHPGRRRGRRTEAALRRHGAVQGTGSRRRRPPVTDAGRSSSRRW